MRCIYNMALHLYSTAIWVASFFNEKARVLWRGQAMATSRLRNFVAENHLPKNKQRCVWVHAASLGEFEQGRPLIERIRAKFPEARIVLTFFSPSGYEVRHSYPGADIVLYLPLDTPHRVSEFLDVLNPDMAFFVKYEFWLNYLAELRRRDIETYIISAIFREGQPFFKPYGAIFREALLSFRKLYVQNIESERLLANIGVTNVAVVGDTRFDRVADIASAARKLPIVEAFARDNKVLVVGSSWDPDEAILADYINRNAGKIRVIVAPHEIRPERISQLLTRLKVRCALYTDTTPDEAAVVDCLIVNTMGMLSSVYQYGQVAYVGGGFGVAVHNTLEAAVWGMPVVFGPNYHKFQEACQLIECGAARSINNQQECEEALDFFFENCDAPAAAAAKYVKERIGASDIIFNETFA